LAWSFLQPFALSRLAGRGTGSSMTFIKTRPKSLRFFDTCMQISENRFVLYIFEDLIR